MAWNSTRNMFSIEQFRCPSGAGSVETMGSTGFTRGRRYFLISPRRGKGEFSHNPANAAFNVALGRIAAAVFALSGT